jgi:hypothetical protein
MATALRLSVIVPLAPGESEWPGLVLQLAPLLDTECELVIVAAGDPVSVAWDGVATVVSLGCVPGRARQMNLGANRARGTQLWFLHADTRLLPNSWNALQLFLECDTQALGFFDLRFRGDGPAATRVNAALANLRARWLGMPFGDQGFVLTAAMFAAIGGFDEMAAYGEDHLLAWTVRRAGFALRPVGAALSTSARKYARDGWLRTTVRHIGLTAIQAWPQWRAWRRDKR